MYIKYNKTTGEVLGQMGWGNSNDPDVAEIDEITWNSLTNPRYSLVNKTFVSGPITTEEIDAKRQSLIDKVNDLCHTKIVSGLPSDALDPGKEMYIYQSAEIDQFNTFVNMMDAVQNNKNVLQRCIKVSTGEDAFVNHTPAQMQQVVADGKIAILNFLQHAKVLKDQIKAASDNATLMAVDIETGW